MEIEAAGFIGKKCGPTRSPIGDHASEADGDCQRGLIAAEFAHFGDGAENAIGVDRSCGRKRRGKEMDESESDKGASQFVESRAGVNAVFHRTRHVVKVCVVAIRAGLQVKYRQLRQGVEQFTGILARN